MHRFLAVLFACVTFSSGPAAATTLPAGEILHQLRSFAQTGRVLYLAAHPDDENTRLIAYLSRGRGYQTAYLSLTRGDGGQNLIGSELRDQLGVIRTQELLAARQIDGGIQFFTRANDFGFSKHPDETLTIWDRQAVLADIVRVIRLFQPDVIVTRFPPQPGGTHGHHTASAQLAIEAFQLAADPTAVPSVADLPPWQAKRVLWNAWTGRGAARPPDVLELDVGGFDPLRGESFGEIAARSRSMHKSQGFGAVGSRGAAPELFQLLAGTPAVEDVMDGVDTSWGRFPGGSRVGTLAREAIHAFNPLEPAAIVPHLLKIHAALEGLPDLPVLQAKRAQLDALIAACLGLHVESVLEAAEVVPGETVALRHVVTLRNEFPVTWSRVAVGGEPLHAPDRTLVPNRPTEIEGPFTLPAATPLTHPYWLREPGTTGTFEVTDPALIGRPDNPPLVTVTHHFAVGDRTIRVPDQPVAIIDDPVRGEVRRPLVAVPPAFLQVLEPLQFFQPGSTRSVALDVVGLRADQEGMLRLEAPAGWRVSPSSQRVRLETAGQRARVTFNVTAPDGDASGHLFAVAELGGREVRTGRTEIRYDHIPTQLLQPAARVKVVSVDVTNRAEQVGYLPGAGDLVAEGLQRLGSRVTLLSLDDLTTERLRAFDAVVLGVRAFNTHEAIAGRLPALFDYVEAGGTVLVQYNTTGGLHTSTLAPYPLQLSRDRVTDESAEVRLLDPEHPALRGPNRITAEDFAHWVQERGLYFPTTWDPQFTPLLAMADPGEPARQGALLVARHGQGWFVYTGLSFFRQLPEGVPGAYRLLANLVSLGSEGAE